MNELPDDLRDLDRTLRGVRFEPRASLGPEVARRARDEDPGGQGSGRRSGGRWVLAAAAAVLLAVAAAVLPGTIGPAVELVTVDRCCYDLDGGGVADDGVLIEAERDDRVHRLKVYEDVDGSGSFSAGDLLRLDRGREIGLHEAAGDLVTIERCCLDFDGGGPHDDGLIVIGVPPDRVVMAAIYERGDGRRPGLAAPLR